MVKKIILFIFISSLFSFENSSSDNPKIILKEMIETCYQVKSLKYTQRKTERISGELKKQISDIKFQKDPFMVYMKQQYPKEGLEVLFKDGENGNNALINTNGFPWVNVNLSPFGDRMRNGQHHTVYESGFHYFASVVEHLTTKYDKLTNQFLLYQGKVKFNNRICHKILVENKNFEYVSHKVEMRQSLLTIAKRYFICEHMMLELNPNVDNYYDVDEGDIIIRPNDYAKTITLIIDEERKIPLKLVVHDDKGLYEQYEFLDLSLDINIPKEEFDKDYSEYGF